MVPTSGDWIPARLGSDEGNDVTKSQLRWPRPSEATVISRTSSVAKPISRLKSSTPLKRAAPQARGPAARRRRLPIRARSRRHSYTSRYLRTSRMLMMFISSVATNRVAPTAKIVLYSMLPVGTSPMPTCAM